MRKTARLYPLVGIQSDYGLKLNEIYVCVLIGFYLGLIDVTRRKSSGRNFQRGPGKWSNRAEERGRDKFSNEKKTITQAMSLNE